MGSCVGSEELRRLDSSVAWRVWLSKRGLTVSTASTVGVGGAAWTLGFVGEAGREILGVVGIGAAMGDCGVTSAVADDCRFGDVDSAVTGNDGFEDDGIADGNCDIEDEGAVVCGCRVEDGGGVAAGGCRVKSADSTRVWDVPQVAFAADSEDAVGAAGAFGLAALSAAAAESNSSSESLLLSSFWRDLNTIGLRCFSEGKVVWLGVTI